LATASARVVVVLVIDAKDERLAAWYAGYGAMPLLDASLSRLLPLATIEAGLREHRRCGADENHGHAGGPALLRQSRYEDATVPAYCGGFRAVHFYDMTHVFGSDRFGVHSAVAAWVVLFGHEHVERAVLGQYANGLPGQRAFLAAGAVRFAVLAKLQVTREIYNLPYHRDGLLGLVPMVAIGLS
jgi:hypothetical protein